MLKANDGIMRTALQAARSIAARRASLFHFTRVANLPAIARLDALVSSSSVYLPEEAGRRRVAVEPLKYKGESILLNPHLRIAEAMMETDTTLEQFRTYLDRHVFFWPTRTDCLKMLDTYRKREPETGFAVLEADTYTLLAAQIKAGDSRVRLTKYDSGSNPRFPGRCSYRKSLRMFLPLECLGQELDEPVPRKVSEIKEVLIEGKVEGLKASLKAVYAASQEELPEEWRRLACPLTMLNGNGKSQ